MQNDKHIILHEVLETGHLKYIISLKELQLHMPHLYKTLYSYYNY